jgi:hypothetical protein
MALALLPNLVFPITQAQVNPLMDGLHQLNILDAGLSEKSQRALGLYFHTFDLWVKSGGKVDYRGQDGHARLIQDAMTFAGPGNPVATRHGDLAAAHLAIDYSDTQIRLRDAGLPLLSSNVNDLLNACRDLSEFAPELEKRAGLLMDVLGKKPL